MDVHARTDGSVLVVSLHGDLDSASAPQVQEDLSTIIEQSDRILVDLSAVPYMSSAGLRTMLLLHRNVETRDGLVGLAGVSAELRSIMAATGFLGFFRVDDTVEQGVRRLAGPAARPAGGVAS